LYCPTSGDILVDEEFNNLAKSFKRKISGKGSGKGIEMNIYVGNLSPETTEDDLRQAFEAFGQVNTATVIKDKFSGESRGFGFVEMPAKNEAETAIAEMDGKDLNGSMIKVNEARPRPDRQGGGGGRGGSGGGGRGRRRY
jgi:RNA recognition motif-containing protein